MRYCANNTLKLNGFKYRYYFGFYGIPGYFLTYDKMVQEILIKKGNNEKDGYLSQGYKDMRYNGQFQQPGDNRKETIA